MKNIDETKAFKLKSQIDIREEKQLVKDTQNQIDKHLKADIKEISKNKKLQKINIVIETKETTMYEEIFGYTNSEIPEKLFDNVNNL